MAAQFIAETHEPLTDVEATEILYEAVDDISSFDLSPILRGFGDKVVYLTNSGGDLDYYRILGEFSRLTRAEMRGFKKLLTWAFETPDSDIVQVPARLLSLLTSA